MSEIADFCRARLAEAESKAERMAADARRNYEECQKPENLGRVSPGWFQWPAVAKLCDRTVELCRVQRRIVELHARWPTLVEGPAALESIAGTPDQVTMRMTARVAWLTAEEYRRKFGDEPPTAEMVLRIARAWSDHPDFDQEWLS